MNPPREPTIDNLINHYEGLIVHDRKMVILFGENKDSEMSKAKQRTLKQDKLILGALKCAKANGYTGED